MAKPTSHQSKITSDSATAILACAAAQQELRPPMAHPFMIGNIRLAPLYIVRPLPYSRRMAWLRHLALRCRDMERSREFYTEVIGLEFFDYRPQGDSIDLTDGTLNITLLSHPPEMERPVLEEGNEYIHFGIIVRDLAEVWNRAKAWGASISKGDVKDRTEVEDLDTVPECSFKILDPDGNVIDITSNREEWRCVTNLPDA